MTLPIETIDGETVQCETYIFKNNNEPGLPSPHYKDIIVRGAKQHNLPPTYIKYLENIETNGYQGKVEIYESIIKQLETSQ